MAHLLETAVLFIGLVVVCGWGRKALRHGLERWPVATETIVLVALFVAARDLLQWIGA